MVKLMSAIRPVMVLDKSANLSESDLKALREEGYVVVHKAAGASVEVFYPPPHLLKDEPGKELDF